MIDRAMISAVWRAFGWKGAARRVAYVLRLRTGLVRRQTPLTEYGEHVPVAWPHRLDGRAFVAIGSIDDQRIVEDAERIVAGELRFFGGDWRHVGVPPRWHVNPATGHEYPRRHWSEIFDDEPGAGDIKDVWEPSRFSSTLPLARAFAVTRDGRYVEQWWRLVESWAADNPPNVGVNWRCAQESSLRAIQLCLGLSLFGDHMASTDERHVVVGQVLAATRERVRPTLDYALSQRNNHAISELAFLLALPGEVDPKLCRLLGEALDDQFFDDGSYSQQSLVYQRLATQTLAWLLAVQPELPDSLSSRVVGVLAASAAFLKRCSDPVSGEMANYGANDGSQLFDLGESSHLDLRSTFALLGADGANRSPLGLEIAAASGSGASTYLTMEGERSKLLTRVGQLDRRPGDEDQQSIELFVDGRRVVIDPGTYRYSGLPPWRQPFVGAAAHSTLRTGGSNAPASYGRFLRVPMTSAELAWRQQDEDVEVIVTRRVEGGGTLWRAVVRAGDDFGVADLAEGTPAVAGWNLAVESVVGDSVVRLDGGVLMTMPSGFVLVERRDDEPGSGWWSPTYGELQQMTVIEVHLEPDVPTLTWFGRSDAAAIDRERALELLSASPFGGRLARGWVNA